MSKAQDITSLFQQALELDRQVQQEERIKERGTDKKLNLHVSDSGQCPRKIGYSLRNEEPSDPVDTSSLANFLVGKSVEAGWSEVMDRVAVVQREVRVEIPFHFFGFDGPAAKDKKITGRIDFLVGMPDLGITVEMKTTSRKAMQFQRKFQPDGKPEHKLQLMWYLFAGRNGLIPDMAQECFDSGVLLYIVKDAAKGQDTFYAYDVPFDRFALELEATRLIGVQNVVDSGGLPERPAGFVPSKFPCSYCDFRSTCWE